MKNWAVGFFVLIIGLLASVYYFAGLRYFIRSLVVVNRMSSEIRETAKLQFNGTDARGAEKGILAGTMLGRVWVWSGKGLKSYVTDEYSVYSFFDGCSEDLRARLNKGEKNVIQQDKYTDMNQWIERVKVGDYVVVYKAREGNGGTIGNLREIYGYNFWLFMNTGIDNECKKQ